MKYSHIIRAILSRPWAIDQDSLAWAAILDVLALRASGERLSDDEIDARIAAAANGPRRGARNSANVAVIPIYGPISPRAGMAERSSGGTTAEQITSDFRGALADPQTDAIVFDIDSPGGNVVGIEELANEIRAARGVKPISAVANHDALSAAYWIGSAADELVVTPSGAVGSIGVWAAHQDLSEAQAKLGVKTTLISKGKFKVEGNQWEPLGDEARAAIQADVDTYYSTFVSAVAKGMSRADRRIGVDDVRSGFGEGRAVLAKRALELGMVDRIDSLENTMQRVARQAIATAPSVGAVSIPATDQDGLPAGLSFADHGERVLLDVKAFAERAGEIRELRAEDGRDLSDAHRDRLAAIDAELLEAHASIARLAEEPAAPPPPARRRGFELLEAANRLGYPTTN